MYSSLVSHITVDHIRVCILWLGLFIQNRTQTPLVTKRTHSPGWVVRLAGVLYHTPKGCGFDSQSGHIPR